MPETLSRFRPTLIISLTGFALLWLRLFDLQVIHHDHYARIADENRIQYAIDIANEIDEEVDPIILICGALLHDIGRTVSINLHGLVGGSIAEELLESLNFGEEQIDRITNVIVRHTATSHIPPQRVEEKIVYDADGLDQLGAMGLLRGFIGKKGSMVGVLERYMSKREKAYDKLFFPTSQRIGKSLDKEMKELIALFTMRLNERKHDVEKITLP